VVLQKEKNKQGIQGRAGQGRAVSNSTVH
jgi:hypothetical protein